MRYLLLEVINHDKIREERQDVLDLEYIRVVQELHCATQTHEQGKTQGCTILLTF